MISLNRVFIVKGCGSDLFWRRGERRPLHSFLIERRTFQSNQIISEKGSKRSSKPDMFKNSCPKTKTGIFLGGSKGPGFVWKMGSRLGKGEGMQTLFSFQYYTGETTPGSTNTFFSPFSFSGMTCTWHEMTTTMTALQSKHPIHFFHSFVFFFPGRLLSSRINKFCFLFLFRVQ